MARKATPVRIHALRAEAACALLKNDNAAISSADRLAAAKALESAACQIRRALVKAGS